jgi:hypothetical protein
MYQLLYSFSEISTRSREAKKGRLDFTLGRNKNFALTVVIGNEFTVVWSSKLLENRQCLNLQRFSLKAYCSQEISRHLREIAKSSC